MLLKVDSVVKKFGGLVAVDNFSLKLRGGELRGIIGPNGAGKTVLINLISGMYPPTSGEIYLNDEITTKLKPYAIARRGLARTFQIPKLFLNLTVLENMLVPSFAAGPNVGDRRKEAFELLKFVKLDALKNEKSKNLSGGQQKLLELARGFIMKPKICLLDEPFAGINPTIKNEIIKIIQVMNQKGVTFIVVSHEMPSINKLCRIVTVMADGKKIAEGKIEEVANDSRVIESYLGGR